MLLTKASYQTPAINSSLPPRRGNSFQRVGIGAADVSGLLVPPNDIRGRRGGAAFRGSGGALGGLANLAFHWGRGRREGGSAESS